MKALSLFKLNDILYYFQTFNWSFHLSVWKQIPINMWEYFWQLFPYIVIGSLFGEFLKFTSWTKFIYLWLTKNKYLSLPVAVILGIISPLCTYGTIPVLLSLYKSGVNIVPLISFLSASSLMNPQLFIMTWGGLGPELALYRLLIVFIFGLVIGLISSTLPENFIVRKKIICGTEDIDAVLNRVKPPFNLKKYAADVLKNLLFVGKVMLIGIFIASIVDLFPLELIFTNVDTSGIIGVIVAAVAGIPLYACGGGTIPMLSSLLAKGMSKGSAIAFMIVGPATRITSYAALSTILKIRFII
ncbi:MAG: permease, partial [Clostridia bacterium]|nr:permease [Clostridia bacterium]